MATTASFEEPFRGIPEQWIRRLRAMHRAEVELPVAKLIMQNPSIPSLSYVVVKQAVVYF